MPDFPSSIYDPRVMANRPGVSYDSTKTKVIFAEDFNLDRDEIVAIEDTLGTNPQGVYATVKAWLTALTSAVSGIVTDFLGLDDTPSSYTDQAGKVVQVNSGEDALEFASLPSSLSGASCGVATRSLDASSGNLNIAHGLGKTPSLVRIRAYVRVSGFSGYYVICIGSSDLSNQSCVVTMEGNSGWDSSQDSSNIINMTGVIYTNGQTATVSADSTNITLAFTLVGSPSSTTMYIEWEAIA